LRHSPWSKPVNHQKNAPEQIARHGDLRHLEGHVAPVDKELRANLDELFPQAGQRPILDVVQQRQCAQKVRKIVLEPAATGMLLAIRRGLMEETGANTVSELVLID
jgi:hypothetical protein